jgi:hypothetical protein
MKECDLDGEKLKASSPHVGTQGQVELLESRTKAPAERRPELDQADVAH